MISLKLSKIQKYFFLGLVLAGLACPKTAIAQYYNGEGRKSVIVVDKKISADEGKNYFDNISAEVKTFSEGSLINFKIVIENKGSEDLEEVKLVDYLPKHLNLLFYPGVYDDKRNILEFSVNSLKVGEAKSYIVVAQIKDLPSSNYADSKLQQTNKVCVEGNKVSDCDEAKYFVNLKSVPTTGNVGIFLQTGLVLGLATTGYGLRKAIRGF